MMAWRQERHEEILEQSAAKERSALCPLWILRGSLSAIGPMTDPESLRAKAAQKAVTTRKRLFFKSTID